MADDLFQTFADAIMESQLFVNTPRELAAIWLEKPVITDDGKSIRICAGMGVKIENGKLVDLPDGEQPTHKILRCRGAHTHSFELDVLNFITGEPETIKL